MTAWQFFLLLSVIYVAPKIHENPAKILSVMSLAAALIFLVLEST